MSSLTDWITQEIPEAINEDAARWMALLDSEDCNEADRLSFARWLDEDPRHCWAFQELSEVWAQLRTLSDVRPLMDQPVVHRLPVARPAAAPSAAVNFSASAANARFWSSLSMCRNICGRPPLSPQNTPRSRRRSGAVE